MADAMSTSTLTGTALLVYGAVGGVVLYLWAVIFPALVARRAAILEQVRQARRAELVGIFLLYVAFGASAAWFLGEHLTSPRDAITYGLSWPALFKGLGAGLYAAGKAAGG